MSFQPAPWPLPAGVHAGWTTRQSGLSQGAYCGFNVARHVGDDEHHVEQNRRDLKRQLIGQPDITWLNQTHSVVVVDILDADKQQGQDGSYTTSLHQACCVMTADCLPVFFWHESGDQVAVAHAGWRGLADGILEQTLAKLAGRGSVFAGIGPAIGVNHFEVGSDVVDAFSGWVDHHQFFKARLVTHKYDCDLVGLAESQLQQLGVAGVFKSNICTYEQKQNFFSYRRDGVTGRMANLIWKTPIL